MQEKMNIVLAMNSKFVMPSMVCMTSVLENNKTPIDFYILYSKLHDTEIEAMETLVKSYGDNYSLTPIKINETYFRECPTFGRSQESYFRLLIQDVLPSNLDRCLYLDGDTIVQKPLDDFYNTHFEEGKALLVCEDISEILFYHKEMNQILDVPLEYQYFNTGVLLFDLKYFRKNFSAKIFLNYVRDNPSKLKFIDQNVINALCYDIAQFVNSSTYNYLEIFVNPILINDTMEKAVVVHFSLKPWKYNYYGVNGRYWWKYARKVFPFQYMTFSIVNFIYRKCLGLALLVIPISKLKKLKRVVIRSQS